MRCPRCKSAEFLNVGAYYVCDLCGFELSKLGLIQCQGCGRRVRVSHCVIKDENLLLLCSQCKKIHEAECRASRREKQS